ncbi:ABC transporter substrate-binding protein [Salinisphaera sp. T31B1]|uniref:ABC transporter substrate-binding protein n=1 Tax=Salinisphaera sp. T31B1 TaxID=727963 RepID=UPI0033420447
MTTNRRSRKIAVRPLRVVTVLLAVLLANAWLTGCSGGESETPTIRFSQQYGVGYLPLMVMRHNKMVEAQAAERGIDQVDIEWVTLGGGASTSAALLSGNLDFAASGVGPMIKMWDKTRGAQNVKALGAINSIPIVLTTSDPEVQSIEDFNKTDRIALPAVKVSIQAVTLQMAAAKQWGNDAYDRLDDLTVSMKHPDAMAAMLSNSEVNAHFGSPPYYQQELERDGIHQVLTSYDVLGGKSTFNTLWASDSFRNDHPKLFAAVFAALKQAMQFIADKPREAAKIYIAEANSKLPEDLIFQIITDPDIEFTTTPKNVMKYARFMHQIKSIDHEAGSWKDMFFPEVANEPGS